MVGIWVVLALAAGDGDEWRCTHEQNRWAEAGLDAPCRLASAGATAEQKRAALIERWKLDGAQTNCVLEALTSADRNRRESVGAWASCVATWPSSKPLWVGMLLADFGARPEGFDELISRLPAAPRDGGWSLAEDLL